MIHKKLTSMPNQMLPAVYLTDWYFSKIKYPIKTKGSYFTKTEESYVYVIYNKSNMLYKIGITTEIKNRIRSIRTVSGCEIEMVLFIQLHTNYDEEATTIESLLHTFFKQRRKIGEWFNLDLKCLIAIKNLFWEIDGEDIKDNIKLHLKSR